MNKGFVPLAIAALCSVTATNAATIELVSQSSETATVTANGNSSSGTFSPDGKFILFTSTAGDLVNLAENGHYQLFLLNTTNNTVQLVSAASNGQFGSGDSVYGSISADNRFVVFQSSSSNLTSGDANQTSDIYVRELTTGTTTLVSHDPTGAPGNSQSEFPQISANGDIVIFESNARNLTANDTNSLRDIFAWKRADNSLQLVSVGADGYGTNTDSSDFSMTPDGRYVLFVASGNNLVVPGKVSTNEVYLRDLQAGTTRWVSSVVTNLPGLATASSANAAMSADARYVFFVATPFNGTSSTLVRVDLNDNSTMIVATNFPPPAPYAAENFGPSVSDDGQFAAFTYRTNVVHWSAATGQFQRVDVTSTGGTATVSSLPMISHDGRKVAFLSDSTDLVAGAGNGELQIYVRDVVAGETKLVTKSLIGAPTFGNEVTAYQFSPDGNTLLFDSYSAEMTTGDNNNSSDLFSWNATDGSITLLSGSRAVAPSLTAFGTSTVGRDSVSADGRFIAFRSTAKLNAKDTNDTYDAYVFDRVAKTNLIPSAGPDGFSVAGGATGIPMISADGTKVAFESSTKGLTGPDDNRTGTSVYVRDLVSGVLANISGTNTGALTLRQLSANGRYVFFTTSAINANQLHRYDLVDNVDLLEATSPSFGDMSVSADGSRIAYVTGLSPLYFHDYSTGNPRQVVASGSVTAELPSKPLLSTDGSILAYYQSGTFRQTNIVTGATNQSGQVRPTRASMSGDGRIIAFENRLATPWEIWLLDWATGKTNLISRAAGQSTNGNGNSEAPVVSAEGRFISFESWATDLVANDSNNIKDVFVYDRFTDHLTLASHGNGTTASGNSGSLNPFFGRGEPFLVFSSAAADLVAGDLNDSIDVFVSRMDDAIPAEDVDGDGLDDAWERATFSTLEFGASDDPDGDGATNLQEFKAGTKANDATSGFAIQSTVLAGDGSASLTWKAAAGHIYQLEFTASLDGSTWAAVGSEIIGGGNDVSTPATATGFYRLRLVQ